MLLKREDLQPVFSFKLRGAYNKLLQLTEEELGRGVIAASAGNHAQGLAMAARKLGIKATIVMPRTTPQIKVDAVRASGGKVVLHGDAYDDASEHAQKLVAEGHGMHPPLRDPDVIAGQGALAWDSAPVFGHLDAIFIPVGGGRLCAGVAAYINACAPT